MKKEENCQQKNKAQETEEWLRLVHEGACCAADDPHKEEKQAFLESLKKDQEQKD